MSITDDSQKVFHSEEEFLDSLIIFYEEDITETRIINTLNILSERNIMETKLYQSILSANNEDKELLIKFSNSFATTFTTLGIYLKTINIYMWLKILFDRFRDEEGIDIKGYYISKMYGNIGFGDFSFTESSEESDIIEKSKEIQFFALQYAEAWNMYLKENASNIEKITKIIRPIELFILTAITVMTHACHIDQKPFENFANMNFKSVLNILSSEYCPRNESIYYEYSTNGLRDDTCMEYLILNKLVNGENCKKFRTLSEVISNGRHLDETFAKLINVSEKSEYEILKQRYKK